MALFDPPITNTDFTLSQEALVNAFNALLACYGNESEAYRQTGIRIRILTLIRRYTKKIETTVVARWDVAKTPEPGRYRNQNEYHYAKFIEIVKVEPNNAWYQAVFDAIVTANGLT